MVKSKILVGCAFGALLVSFDGADASMRALLRKCDEERRLAQVCEVMRDNQQRLKVLDEMGLDQTARDQIDLIMRNGAIIVTEEEGSEPIVYRF